MNWSKFKNIAILAFLVINVLLYMLNVDKFNKQFILSQKQVDRIRSILSENKISTSYINLPRKFEPVSSMKFVKRKITANKIYGTFFNEAEEIKNSVGQDKITYFQEDEGTLSIYKNGLIKFEADRSDREVSITDHRETRWLAENYMKKLTFLKNKYMFTQRYVNDNLFVYEYNPIYEGKYMFSSYVRITTSTRGLENIEIFEVDFAGFTSERKEILSIDRVLLNLMITIGDVSSYKNDLDRFSNEDIQINDIDLGYNVRKKYIEEDIIQTAEPYYKILIDDSDIYYVNAYTNRIYDQNLEPAF